MIMDTRLESESEDARILLFWQNTVMSIPREWTNLGARCDFPVARTEPKGA